MDVDVARWILEFLLRQPLDDRVLNKLVGVLPLPTDDLSLKKAMLLRRIDSEIEKGCASEKILELLERIEELDYQAGVKASEAMRAAYCAVAVDCAVRLLDESEVKEGKYFDAVKGIWRGRVWKMERSENVGLVSDELRSWRDDIEAAVWDAGVCENLRMKCRESDALKSVRVYVAEAWGKMGPSFLELVVQAVSDEKMREVLTWGSNPMRDQDPGRDSIGGKSSKEMGKRVVVPRRKHVATKRNKGMKIVDSEELDRRAASNNYDLPPIPEVNNMQEVLKASSLELQAVVKDPLPDARQLADNIISSLARENMNQESTVGDGSRVPIDALNPYADKSTEAVAVNEVNVGDGSCTHQDNRPKPSLMERNRTARTYEWDDSLDRMPEGSPDCGNRLHLPTPSRRLISPLKKYEFTKLARRRKMKKWSTLEEETLRTGVQKYGRGNWKLILNMYKDIFEERTEVDLKDKWRNMIRY